VSNLNLRKETTQLLAQEVKYIAWSNWRLPIQGINQKLDSIFPGDPVDSIPAKRELAGEFLTWLNTQEAVDTLLGFVVQTANQNYEGFLVIVEGVISNEDLLSSEFLEELTAATINEIAETFVFCLAKE
jgi:hypothetical protein